MLIRFEIQNYKSYKNSTALSLITNSKIRKGGHEINIDKFDILKYASIYGANASGKTNLFSALLTLRKLIETGFANNISTFKDNDKEPILFNVLFEKNEHIYQYKLALDIPNNLCGFTVKDESLSVLLPNVNKEFNLYDNKGINIADFETDKMSAMFLPDIFKKCKEDPSQILLNVLPKNTIIPTGGEGIDYIKEAYDFFINDLIFVTNNIDIYSTINPSTIENVSSKVNRYDTGVKKIILKECGLNDVKSLIPNDVLKQIINDITNPFSKKHNQTISITNGNMIFNFTPNERGDITVKSISCQHKGIDNLLNFEEESEGTKRIILLCSLLFSKKQNDKVFIIDEIEKSLHPLLVEQLFADFIDFNFNNKSQLIFSSQQVSLMDELLRKDEIMLLSKNPSGISGITPLIAFKDIRSDTKISKNYCEGRYGGVPQNKTIYYDN